MKKYDILYADPPWKYKDKLKTQVGGKELSVGFQLIRVQVYFFDSHRYLFSFSILPFIKPPNEKI